MNARVLWDVASLARLLGTLFPTGHERSLFDPQLTDLDLRVSSADSETILYFMIQA